MQPKASTIQQPSAKSAPKLKSKPSFQSKSVYNEIAVTKRFSSAVACIDSARHGSLVFRHTKAVASGLHIPVKLIHVKQWAASEPCPSDPIKWQLERREAQDYLYRILETEHEPLILKNRLVLNGHAGQEIARWATDHTENLMAMLTRCEPESSDSSHSGRDYALGQTAQKLMDGSLASLLLIPPETVDAEVVRYRRLLVPLDGSCRAESVLPFAVRIAHKHGAELILTYIVPEPEIIQTNLGDKEANALIAGLRQFNQQNAQVYLSRLQSRLSNDNFQVRTVIDSNGDPRDSLLQIAKREGADLFVLSGRGKGAVNDISCGSVAHHIAAHSAVPLLLIRQQQPMPVNQMKLPQRPYRAMFFRESAH